MVGGWFPTLAGGARPSRRRGGPYVGWSFGINKTMWEEDPRWQEASFRSAVLFVALASVGVAAWSAWTRDWSLLGSWALIWSGIGCVLVLYAAIIWSVGHSIAFVARKVRSRLQQKRGND